VIGFAPLAIEHFALLLGWLADPGVKEWWYPDRTFSAAEIEAKYTPRLSGTSPTSSFIASQDGEPFGFIQAYPTEAEPEYHRAIGAAPGWVGIDFYIGVPDRRNRGLGPLMIDTFVSNVVFGGPDRVPGCLSGPHPDNHRSIRALEKAGFVRGELVAVPGDDGGPELIMLRPNRR